MANKKFIADLLRTITSDVDYNELKKLYKKKEFTEMEVFQALAKTPKNGVKPMDALIKLETSGKGFSTEEKQIIAEIFPKSTIPKINSKSKFNKELTKRYEQELNSYIKRANRIERKVEEASDRALTVAFKVDMPDKEIFERLPLAEKIAAIKKVHEAYKLLRDKASREEMIRESIVAYEDPSEGVATEEEIRAALDKNYIARILGLKDRSRKIQKFARNIAASNIAENAKAGIVGGPISTSNIRTITLSYASKKMSQKISKLESAKALADLTKTSTKVAKTKVVGKTVYSNGKRIKRRKK